MDHSVLTYLYMFVLFSLICLNIQLLDKASSISHLFLNIQQNMQWFKQDTTIFSNTENENEKTSGVCSVTSTPKKSVMYISNQNAESSVLPNLVLRYSNEYNLTLCKSYDMVYKDGRACCDVIMVKEVEGIEKMKQSLPKDMFVMTSVEHPIRHFLQTYKHAGIHEVMTSLFGNKLSKWNAMRKFLQIDQHINEAHAIDNKDSISVLHSLPRNLQLTNLGIRDFDPYDLNRKIATFDFIVVREMFDESLVILRDRLCCSIQDVLYDKAQQELTEITIPKDIEDAILRYNKDDMILYRTALKRLKRSILEHSDFEQVHGIYQYEQRRHSKLKTKMVPRT
ncbi:galactosylceramide sulfotransferase-like [Hydractinia symbiolongicarpus]|uniref:galactosylceramide sulfotransferase-like n=1 Tax=Hydractinia symbiolongicarpus TaxID=13093 RepID=UPI00254D4073|nr:galactosylceramide sulfotransferase-like [Hydractinia symbiolongicarpus]